MSMYVIINVRNHEDRTMANTTKGTDTLELNLLQSQFVNAYFENDESPTHTAKAMGWSDRGRCSSMMRSQKVQIEIAKRKQQIQMFRACSDKFNISRADKQRVLWDIAQTGVKKVFDAIGNEVMMNPAAAIAAIREMNLMDGIHKPTQIELEITAVDNRSEAEVLDNIRRLTIEAEQLTT